MEAYFCISHLHTQIVIFIPVSQVLCPYGHRTCVYIFNIYILQIRIKKSLLVSYSVFHGSKRYQSAAPISLLLIPLIKAGDFLTDVQLLLSIHLQGHGCYCLIQAGVTPSQMFS